MRVIGNLVGRVTAIFTHNENGYIQDTGRDIVVQRNAQDVQDENELQQRRRELKNYKNELQPYFVGAVDNKAIEILYKYVANINQNAYNAENLLITPPYLTTDNNGYRWYYTTGFSFIYGTRVDHNNATYNYYEIRHFKTADVFVIAEINAKNDFKRVGSSVTDFVYTPMRFGISAHITKLGQGYRSSRYKVRSFFGKVTWKWNTWNQGGGGNNWTWQAFSSLQHFHETEYVDNPSSHHNSHLFGRNSTWTTAPYNYEVVCKISNFFYRSNTYLPLKQKVINAYNTIQRITHLEREIPKIYS